jgi:RHS repeat-associated protein
MLVDVTTGTVVQQLAFDEYGRVLSDSNPGFQPLGFAGGIYDSDTGLVRFGSRDYDAETGRWTAKDKIGFGGRNANLYNYVNDDPVNAIDPTGHVAFLVSGLAGAAIGAAAGGLGAAIDNRDVGAGMLAGAAAGFLAGSGAWLGGLMLAEAPEVAIALGQSMSFVGNVTGQLVQDKRDPQRNPCGVQFRSGRAYPFARRLSHLYSVVWPFRR